MRLVMHLVDRLLYELSSVVHRSRRNTEDSSSSRVMRLVSQWWPECLGTLHVFLTFSVCKLKVIDNIRSPKSPSKVFPNVP